MSSNGQSMNVKIAILTDVFFVMGILVASTVLGAIAQAFPGTSITGIQMIMTLAMVSAFIFMFVAGYFGNFMDKKVMAIIGLFVMLIGGLIPTVLNTSLSFVYISSLCIGAGQGIVKTAITGINAQMLTGHERSKMFGWQTAFQNLGPVVLMLLAGWLAARSGNWTHAYLVFALYIIAIVVTFVLLPKVPPIPVEGGKKKREPVPFRIYVLGFFLGWFAVGYSCFFLNAPIYITMEGLGDPSKIGVVMSLSTLFGFISGFIFTYFLKIMKHQVVTFAAVLCALGYIILLAAPSMATIYIASIISGFAFTQAMAGGLQHVSEIAKPEQVSASMGTFLSMTSIGAVLSPFILNGITTLIPGEGLIRVFITSVILLVILAVCLAAWGVSMSKFVAAKPAEPVPAAE